MPFPFRYDPEVLARFPQLRSTLLLAEGVDASADPGPAIAGFTTMANRRLAAASEGEFPEIQAWRRAFSAMGLKPTQYRCAAEALLRRYRKEGALPALRPLIDLCNAASLAFAIPVAVFDTDGIADGLSVRPARGDEVFRTFSGESEHPEAGEIIFADGAGRAHARRWTNRQGSWSAVRPETGRALIVAEALHDTAAADVAALAAALREALGTTWPGCSVNAVTAE